MTGRGGREKRKHHKKKARDWEGQESRKKRNNDKVRETENETFVILEGTIWF